MARGINKVILVGNIGNDPETKYTQGGVAVTKCSLATSAMRKDRDGNQQERAEWHRITFFGKLGEIAGEYLKKGSQVYVEGSIRYDKYTGQDGIDKYTTDIIADQMQMLGGRQDGGGQQDRPQGQSRQQRGNADQQQGRGYGQQQGQGHVQQRREPPPMDDFADDGIPFEYRGTP